MIWIVFNVIKYGCACTVKYITWIFTQVYFFYLNLISVIKVWKRIFGCDRQLSKYICSKIQHKPKINMITIIK